MRLFFILIGLALGVSAVVGLPLAWDGSAVLFGLLDSQAPFVVLDRFSMVPLNLPVLWVSAITDNVPLLIFSFSVVYLCMTLLAFGVSWALANTGVQTRPLYVWAALGVGLVALPGQASIIGQAMIAIQLFWIVMMALMTGLPRWSWLILVLLAPFLFFLHPLAIVLFATASACALFLGWQVPARRRAFLTAATAFGLLAAIAGARFLLNVSPYESDVMQWETVQVHFNASVRGFPLVAYLFVLAAVGLIAAAPRIARAQPSRLRRVQLAGLVCIALAGVCLVYWATSPIRWARALDYRTWLFFMMLPLLFVAVFESRRILLAQDLHAADGMHPDDWSFRRRVIQLAAVVFLLVLSVQSFVWLNLSNRLRAEIALTAPGCIATTTFEWLQGTVMDDWAITPFAFLLEGRAPTHLILKGTGCARADYAQGLPTAVYPPNDRIQYQRWTSRWFTFDTLQRAVTGANTQN